MERTRFPRIRIIHISPMWMGLLCLATCLTPLPALALSVQNVPNPQENETWVTDMAGILTDETEAQLNQIITDLEAANGAEMAVVTVPQTAPSASPKAFATELFNHWGIGKEEQNNGVLFLISVNERRVEIETGYGIEAMLPDAQVGHVIDTQITPRFKQGDFDGGTVAGTQAIAAALADTVPSTDSSSSSPLDQTTRSQPAISSPHNSGALSLGTVLGGFIMLCFMGLALAHIFSPRSNRRSGKGQHHNASGNAFWGDHHSSSGGGGSDGGGFGGGSSGGGGAGGGW